MSTISSHWCLAKWSGLLRKKGLDSRHCNQCYLCLCVCDHGPETGFRLRGNTCSWGQGKVLQHVRVCVSMCIQPYYWSENTDCVPGSTVLMHTGMSEGTCHGKRQWVVCVCGQWVSKSWDPLWSTSTRMWQGCLPLWVHTFACVRILHAATTLAAFHNLCFTKFMVFSSLCRTGLREHWPGTHISKQVEHAAHVVTQALCSAPPAAHMKTALFNTLKPFLYYTLPVTRTDLKKLNSNLKYGVDIDDIYHDSCIYKQFFKEY